MISTSLEKKKSSRASCRKITETQKCHIKPNLLLKEATEKKRTMKSLIFALILTLSLCARGISTEKTLSHADLEAIKNEVENLEEIIPIVEEEQRLEEMIENLKDDVRNCIDRENYLFFVRVSKPFHQSRGSRVLASSHQPL